ncbi:Protein DENND6A [Echinococcus granulosus]|uniref:Protein FAM116B n=1 Tax=Echinococcus granulosus TaxID=6210 RepID=A0A068X0Q8_ECHGR|nr:Protein DENND6A [Echinococcus granulosus]CDS23558.1 protein FAM116B [Echinococcus granulosus]
MICCSHHRMDGSIIPLDRLSQWIYAVCVVNFDVDLGQTLEYVYPQHIQLTEAERISISYLAFPDSHSSCEANSQHHFRFKCTSIGRLLLKNFSLLYKSYCSAFLPMFDVCFGYAFFKQEKDFTQKRHYSQKSIVILSPLPFDVFFYEIAKIVANAYFSHGTEGIEKSCREIDSWPAPKTNEQLTLPLLGTTYSLRISSAAGTAIPASESPVCGESSSNKEDKQDSGSLSSFSSSFSLSLLAEAILDCVDQTISNKSSTGILDIHSSSRNSNSLCDLVWDGESLIKMQDVELSLDSRHYVQAFAPVLAHLQRLWELVITAQPLLVMAPNPNQASQTVQALVSCIAPFAFSADYRPFFTIYDTEFKEVSRGCTSSPIKILGVTNPFFSKALHHWPNVIRLGEVKNIDKRKKMHQHSSKTLLEDMKSGLYSRYKPFLKRDAGFFKRLKKALTDGTPDECISRAIHRFFQELTMSFLIPLEHYLSSLMPLHRDISPYRCVPELNRFNMNDFFRTLETAGPRLTCDVKGDWVGLYKLFFSGPHFIHWLSHREGEIMEKLHSLHLDAILRANFDLWIEKRSEVEIVDMIIRLNQLAARYGHMVCKVEGIRRQIAVLLDALPEDLRQVVGRSSTGTGAPISVNGRG